MMIRSNSWLDDLTEGYVSEAIDCGFVIHDEVGPGYLEPVYKNSMCVELIARGIPFECEKVFSVQYREKTVGVHR